MPPERKFPVVIPVIAVLGLILGLAGLLIIKTADLSRSSLPVLGAVPEFQFVKQNGSPFGLNDMTGKVNVVDFIFTTCPGVCPTMSANMAMLYKRFEGNDKVQFVSISVDPDRDSLSVLQEYANGFGVNDSRWVFLWHPIDEIVKLSEKGFMLAANDLPNLPMGHSSRFILVDQERRIRGYYDGTDDASLNKLADDIRRLVRAI